jgi:regulator of sigma E protease
MRKLITHEIPPDSIGGPGTIYEVAVKSAEAGLDTYLSAMAMVSVNLALVNLLPIPILDGFGLLSRPRNSEPRRPRPPGHVDGVGDPQ